MLSSGPRKLLLAVLPAYAFRSQLPNTFKHSRCDDNEKSISSTSDKIRTKNSDAGACDIAIYLTEESQTTLRNHLDKVGLKNVHFEPQVIIRRDADPDSVFQFEPLFGERVAFRLKGIAETFALGDKAVTVSAVLQYNTACVITFTLIIDDFRVLAMRKL